MCRDDLAKLFAWLLMRVCLIERQEGLGGLKGRVKCTKHKQLHPGLLKRKFDALTAHVAPTVQPPLTACLNAAHTQRSLKEQMSPLTMTELAVHIAHG